jgi:hypothetical protein
MLCALPCSSFCTQLFIILVALELLLLCMRMLYFCMAAEKVGALVRMVLIVIKVSCVCALKTHVSAACADDV